MSEVQHKEVQLRLGMRRQGVISPLEPIVRLDTNNDLAMRLAVIATERARVARQDWLIKQVAKKVIAKREEEQSNGSD